MQRSAVQDSMVVDKPWHNGHVQLLTLLLCGANGGMYIQVAADGIYVVSFVLCVCVCVCVCAYTRCRVSIQRLYIHANVTKNFSHDCACLLRSAYLPHVQFLAIDKTLILLVDCPRFDLTASNHKA